MKVLFISPEVYPLVKTGGLADVAGALPLALQRLGVEVRVLLPAYRGVLDKVDGIAPAVELRNVLGRTATVWSGTVENGLRVLLLDAPELFDREGGPYLDSTGVDWADNDIRFATLSLAGALLAAGGLPGWRPDVVHVHDWQAAPTLAYLTERPAKVKTVLTIHNLAFQGCFSADQVAPLDLPAALFSIDGFEYYAGISFLKSGITQADAITTVSPTYAQEILGPNDGMGLDGVLRRCRSRLSGIVNGIDTDVWDPATDPHLSHHYSAADLRGKARGKASLQVELGLDGSVDVPLFGVVSRLSDQKGMDLLLESLAALTAIGQLAVLGSGDVAIETALATAAAAQPGRVAFVPGYHEGLAHRIQAGADVVVVPSRFEPCGLTQLCGLRYGTLPLVSRVGGLADTVIDANYAALADNVATGFVFSPTSATAFERAIERVGTLWSDQSNWAALRQRAMTRDVTWNGPAAQYVALYRHLLAE